MEGGCVTSLGHITKQFKAKNPDPKFLASAAALPPLHLSLSLAQRDMLPSVVRSSLGSLHLCSQQHIRSPP